MKKLLYYIALSCLVLFGYSCSSDDTSNFQSEELYEVTFNISSFSSEVSNISLRSTLFDAKVKYLRYIILNRDIDHEMIVEEKQLEGAAITVPLKLQLRKGNYRMCVYGSEKPFTPEKIRSRQDIGAGNVDYTNSIKIKDFTTPNQYCNSVDFSVTNANITQNIELKRPIGKISLAISDLAKAPADVKTLIPVLVASNNVQADAVSYYVASGNIIMNSGESVFQGAAESDPSTPYASIYIDRSKFGSIDEAHPFDFYMPQTVNINYSASVPTFNYNEIRYDLYLQGSKTSKMEYQKVVSDDPAYLDNSGNKNNNVVFMVRVKKGIVIKPNEQILIKGKLFKDSQLSVVIKNTWGETINQTY